MDLQPKVLMFYKKYCQKRSMYQLKLLLNLIADIIIMNRKGIP